METSSNNYKNMYWDQVRKRKLLEEQYGEVMYITDPLEVIIEDEQENEEEEQEQDVFYAGTRTSNP